jgi:hypothetical protein
MRLVIVLSVAAAATVMLGVILIAASVVMRLLTKGQPANMARLGLDLVAAGIVFGLVVLVVFGITRIATAGRPRTSGGGADYRRGTSRQQAAPSSSGPGKSPGHGRGQGNGKERQRAGARPAGGGRSARPLNPTNVYTPGGLIDVPRDRRAPGMPAGQPIPEILRTAGPPPASAASAPGTPGGGWGQDWPSSAWARTQPPHPGHQPGMHPGGSGRGAYAPGGPPPPSMPQREHLRPQETPRPGHAVPPREPVPPRGAAPSPKPRPGHPGPPRDSRLLHDTGPSREGMAPGGPIRPGGPVPPRDPAHPPPGQGPRQGSSAGAARHAGGPGHAAPGGYRAGPGYAGSPGPAEASEQFDGGYAKVIRASGHPVRPSGPARPLGPGRLSDPARPATPAADVYVYRDTDGLPGDSGSSAPGPDEKDPAYWYDLPVTGPAGSDQPEGVLNETRGPFEPLVSSADPPGTPPRISADTGATAEAGRGGGTWPAPHADHPAETDPAGEGQEQGYIAQARRLERIKDLYLTAEAIGEANVGKHFDQLPAGPADEAPGRTRPPDGPAGPPEGPRVAADQPRAW